ncbi:MAG: lipid A deacylase LpxR family protein [Hyphomonadaceae bacterium]
MRSVLRWASTLWLTASGAAFAELPRWLSDDQGEWTYNLVHENDLVDAGHDRNYTSGVMITATSPPVDPQSPIWRPVWEATKWVTGINDGLQVRREYSLSHLMFTPHDLTLNPPDPDDRPYAGMMLLSLGVIGAHQNEQRQRFDTFNYTIALIGSQSRADDIQTWLHEYQEGIIPQGWRTQLPNDVVAGVSYQRTLRYPLTDDGPWGADWSVHWGGSLGYIQTNANAGLSARVGFNLPNDFGLPRIAPSVPASGFFEPDADHGVYLFAGVQRRYVWYDVTIDEAPAHAPASIDREPWVSDGQVGWVAYWRKFHFGYTRVWRGRAFRTQQHEDSFGVWAAGFRTRFCLCLLDR